MVDDGEKKESFSWKHPTHTFFDCGFLFFFFSLFFCGKMPQKWFVVLFCFMYVQSLVIPQGATKIDKEKVKNTTTQKKFHGEKNRRIENDCLLRLLFKLYYFSFLHFVFVSFSVKPSFHSLFFFFSPVLPFIFVGWFCVIWLEKKIFFL